MAKNMCQGTLAILTAVLFSVSLALARSSGSQRAPHKTTNIDVPQAARLGNGPELKAGSYRVTVTESASPEVEFYQRGKLIAETPAKLVAQNRKSTQTDISYNRQGKNQVITEMDINGWNQKVVFGGTAKASGT